MSRSRPLTFAAARQEAYRLLGDAADWLRGWPDLNAGQREALTRAFTAIGEAKDALNDAANAADRPQGRNSR